MNFEALILRKLFEVCVGYFRGLDEELPIYIQMGLNQNQASEITALLGTIRGNVNDFVNLREENIEAVRASDGTVLGFFINIGHLFNGLFGIFIRR